METPYYQYNRTILKEILHTAKSEAKKYDFIIHYAVKANANPNIIEEISKYGFGADCVSGNEIKRAISKNIPNNKIVFAGVGKTKKELEYAIDQNIFMINVESWEELNLINIIAKEKNRHIDIALRITPEIDAATHNKVTTGMLKHKFGFYIEEVSNLIKKGRAYKNLQIKGLHFHIGSQILNLSIFEELAQKASEINKLFLESSYNITTLNMGGGLGVYYSDVNTARYPNFKEYFAIFNKHLKRRRNQTVHFELGRSLVANCGDLITTVLYTKQNSLKKFIIVDAGMTDLIRPALYNSKHYIENISSNEDIVDYDVAGPICETSDVFAKKIGLNKCKQGDLLKIHTTGAYGEVMASNYNLREKPKSIFVAE